MLLRDFVSDLTGLPGTSGIRLSKTDSRASKCSLRDVELEVNRAAFSSRSIIFIALAEEFQTSRGAIWVVATGVQIEAEMEAMLLGVSWSAERGWRTVPELINC